MKHKLSIVKKPSYDGNFYESAVTSTKNKANAIYSCEAFVNY